MLATTIDKYILTPPLDFYTTNTVVASLGIVLDSLGLERLNFCCYAYCAFIYFGGTDSEKRVSLAYFYFLYGWGSGYDVTIYKHHVTVNGILVYTGTCIPVCHCAEQRSASV